MQVNDYSTIKKVSIALCAYNGESFLAEQLESFLAQTTLPDELIVCDDFSSDQSVQIVENFAQKAPFAVKIFCNKQNLGIIKNFEQAVSLCTGDIIFLSDQDDVWIPEKIALTLEEFAKSPDVGMVFSNAELVNDELDPLGIYLSDLTFTDEMYRLNNSDKFLKELLKRNYFTGATLAFRADFREKMFPFPANIPQMIHDGWIALIIYISAKYAYIEKPLIKYRRHSRQHLGLSNENPVKKLRGNDVYSYLVKTRQTEYERIEEILNNLKTRPKLHKQLEQIKPLAFQTLAETLEAIEHLNYRIALPNNRIFRLQAIVREIRRGGYDNYSNGLLSASKDFLRIRNLADIKNFFNKFKNIKSKLQQRRRKVLSENLYQKWINETSQSQSTERLEVLRQVADSEYKPLISIVMPVYNVDEKWLRLAIESVLAQSYQNWELCIADDNSSAAHIKTVLQEYSAKDSRVKVAYRQQNGHIAAASNTALEMAGGDFVALLDHDDEFHPDALLYVSKEIIDDPQAALIYTDEDKIDYKNRRSDAAFKPDWSADLLYSLNLVTHLAVFKRSVLIKSGGFMENVDGSQDYDLVLRFIEQIDESQIKHIPRILYHWRAIEGSVALDSTHKNYAHDAARQAIRAHLERRGVEATVTKGFADYHRVIYDLPNPAPKVSVIIEHDKLNDAFKETLDFFLNETVYEDFEILVGSNHWNTHDFAEEIKEFDFHGKIRVFFIENDIDFRAERLNKIAGKATGEILVFVDADAVPLDEDWLRELASQAYRSEIGAVGGKILYNDDTVRFAGYILGINEVCGRAHHLLPREAAGNFARLQVINNFSAVSAECLAVKRGDFFAVNGFDDEYFPKDLFDVDFCLRLETCGKRNLLTPYAELKQILPPEKTEISVEESRLLALRWENKIKHDPFYNPNLTRQDESFQVEFPPRSV